MNAITKERLKTRLAVINDHYIETMFSEWPAPLGIQVHNAEVDAIRALIESSGEQARPAPPAESPRSSTVEQGPYKAQVPGSIPGGAITEEQWEMIGFFDANIPVEADENHGELTEKGQLLRNRIRALLLAPPAAPVRVTREWVDEVLIELAKNARWDGKPDEVVKFKGGVVVGRGMIIVGARDVLINRLRTSGVVVDEER